MEKLSFLKNGIHFDFNIDNDGHLIFEHIGTNADYSFPTGVLLTAVEVQTTGSNPNDHHGAKHTGNFDIFYKGHTETENEIVLQLENDKISVKQHYVFFDDLKTFRAFAEVQNISKEPVGLEYISSFCMNGLTATEVLIPHNGWMRELDWRSYRLNELGYSPVSSFSTKRIAVSNTGTWSTKEHLPMGCLKGTEDTFLWQIENNHSWNWEISDIKTKLYVKLSGPCEQENGWWKILMPGESYITPFSAISVADSFDNAVAEMTEYRRKISYKNKYNSNLPVIFNDYMMCLNADPTTEKELPVIDAAAKVGVEIYCMDAGWYADGNWWDTVGEWNVCERRFINGMKEVFDAIKDKGMIPGIWLEPESMGINCPLAKTFDDSCFFMRHGKRVVDHGRYQLDFRSETVRQHLDSVVDRLVKDYGIGYFKFDYNIDPGVGTETDADSFGDGLEKAAAAYIDWVDNLYTRYPDLMIESCSSGGMRMDYKTLTHFSLQSLTDASNCRPTAAIAAMSATAVIPEQAAVWSIPLRSDSAETVALNMVNSAFKRIHLSGETAFLSEENVNLVKEAINYYKSIRSEIPTLKPFFPLGLVHFEDNFTACGYESAEKMYVCVTRLKDSDSITMTLPKSAKNCKIAYPVKTNSTAVLDGNKLTVKMPPESGIIVEVY